ncbi:RNase P subunit p30-domain-containing protein [Chaetomidium leptoderma]|uniref:RNase P subunit p30-domain-containing protein n=1 Tax=Chaetomidium leptoderma TaxID=669021 RepID=A0AAN6ZV88_9PEZI|nr:RNase P subunit p30-domain-containing protein [Chaetomidium leptoderma]
MLYDLNIAWSPGTPAAELERTLKFAKNLGYDVVALNHIISDAAIPTQPTPITNPIPQLTPPHPSYPSSSSSSTTNLSTTAPSSLPPPTTNQLPTTLRRATLTITDPATTNYRLADHARAYDLVALRPTSDKSFSWACLSTTDPPALVSLDLASHLGWHVHHRTAMAAVQRGVRFEVCYSQAFGGGGVGDSGNRQRVNFIGNVQSLLRATKGRGVIISSEARGVLGLRAPADVVNLMAVWGLGPEKGFAALGEGARAVVVNEGIKRRGFRGVVDVEEEGGNGNKGKKQKQQKQQQGQKRKNGDGAVAGAGAGGGQQGEMSKRQAKKMKKEASQAKA